MVQQIQSLLIAGTIFAYGQTGTGKTHTMEGSPQWCLSPQGSGATRLSAESFQTRLTTCSVQSLGPRVLRETAAHRLGKEFLVRASYLELYMEEIRDLLSKACVMCLF
jgi:hypothetical protein